MLFRTVIAGYAERLEDENHLQLQKHRLLRPDQVRVEIARGLCAIDDQLSADPKLKKRFDKVVLTMPVRE